MEGAFVTPDFLAPLDLAAHRALVPTGLVTKGMFFQQVLEDAKKAGGDVGPKSRYLPFKDYPLEEWIEVLVACAERAHPRTPIREALRRMGGHSFKTFAESTIGKVLFSADARNVEDILALVPKAYALTTPSSKVELVSAEPGRGVLALREVWDFVDCYQIGVVEGGLRMLGKVPRIGIRKLGPAAADFEISWG